jgi:hypothetical protein
MEIPKTDVLAVDVHLPKGPKINRSLISSKTPNHVVDAADCKA